MAQGKLFYGWIVIPVAWFVYGFGISPAFYSWGIFLPKLLEDLDMSRTEVGAVFGLFTLCYSVSGPFVGMAISRWGLRRVMTAGSLLAAGGLFLVSRADSVLDFYVGYSVLTGLGVGFSTIIPAQNLASNWFIKYRATAISIVMTGGGIVARIAVVPLDRYVMESYSWRQGWLVCAGLSVVVAVIAAALVRNTPEDVGQRPDGEVSVAPAPPGGDTDRQSDAPSQASGPAAGARVEWTARQALRTRQFWLIVVSGVAYAVPWGVVVNHGSLHLKDLGVDPIVAAGIIGNMALISILGRFSGALGDLIAPEKLLGLAILIEGVGVAGLMVADTRALATISILALGIGFGIAYISAATVFSAFFGRRAFATTAGTRLSITGIANGLGPLAAGAVYDTLGSYQLAFGALAVVALLGGVSAFLARPPVHPLEARR